MSELWPDAKCKLEESGETNFFESGLLKLNCDKAHNLLKWFPVLDYKETVVNTIEWFKNYYIKDEFTNHEFTKKQIEYYVQLAKRKELTWAIR